ncbi:MAG TPA: glycosyltransferase family 1 protein [Streptosporangiaceae bacterium]|nr:glycosyltransferase family 1 protein [Streptosporangiaceae bacterium]
MRIAYVTESFPPDVNGVAHTAVRVAEHLVSRGHEPLVIAPEPARGLALPDRTLGFPVVRVRSLGLPVYPGFRVGLPGRAVRDAIARHRADLVHLAGPFVLGAGGCAAAKSLGIPIVSVYATDLPAYARSYHTGRIGQGACWRRLRSIHNACDRTLAPCTATAADLDANGIERVWIWARGVDSVRFDPAKRSEAMHAQFAPNGELVVGYVGRLAAEKRVDLLAEVSRLPGVRLVIVGSGPAEALIRKAVPDALYLGQRIGADLATIYASLDAFVHSGPHDTFGQTLQEAAASGLPVIAPAAGGPIDLVRDGVTGFLVTPGEGAALAAAVARLKAEPGLRAAQGRAARQMVLGRSWPVMCDQLIGHYQAILQARGSGQAARTTSLEAEAASLEAEAALLASGQAIVTSAHQFLAAENELLASDVALRRAGESRQEGEGTQREEVVA